MLWKFVRANSQGAVVIAKGQKVGERIVSQVFAPDINNLGEIVFIAKFVDGGSAIILAIPAIPEPGTWALLANGLIGLGTYRRSLDSGAVAVAAAT